MDSHVFLNGLFLGFGLSYAGAVDGFRPTRFALGEVRRCFALVLFGDGDGRRWLETVVGRYSGAGVVAANEATPADAARALHGKKVICSHIWF